MELREKKGYQTTNKKQYITIRATTINRDPAKDPKQNESRMRTESWHRVRKEEHEGESKRRVRKAVLAKFGCQTNQRKVKRRRDEATHLISWPNQRFQKSLLQKN
jgi:hypothetical protein